MKQLLLFVLSFLWIIVYSQDPLLTGVDPDEATIPELLTVEISGSNTHFNMGTGTTVLFNMGSSTIYPISVNEISSTLIEAEILVSNYKTPGLYDIYTNNYYDGQLILQEAFTVNANPNPPYIESINPEESSAGEMVSLTVIGVNTNFTQGVNYAYLFNNYYYLLDNNITVLTDETIIIEFPITTGSSTGTYDLKVVSSWDGALYLYDVFTVYPDADLPYLIDINPDTATIPESLIVTISGEETHFSQGTGTTVKLKQGSSTINSYNVNEASDEELTAQFNFDNFDNPGNYDVHTINAIDGYLSLDNAFYLNPNPYMPHLASIDPDSAQPGETLDVSISGQYTSFTQGTGTTVYLKKGYNYIHPTSTSTVNDELVNASFSFEYDEILGNYDVTTISDADGYLTLYDGFTIYEPIPVLLSIDPDSAQSGESLDVSIIGQFTSFTEGTGTTIYLKKDDNYIYPTATTLVNDELINANFSFENEVSTGVYDVTTINDIDGNLTIENGFTIYEPIPMLISIDPEFGYLGDSFDLTIYGENTNFMEDSYLDVSLINEYFEIYPTEVSPQSNTELLTSIEIPEYAESGVYNVLISSSVDGDLYLNNAFEVLDTITTSDPEQHISTFKVFPNPSDGIINILFVQKNMKKTNLRIIDLSGCIRFERSFRENELNNQIITLSTIPKGVYYIEISSENKLYTEKIIIH